jgi:Shedu protein SduA, C-terminal
LGNLTPIHARIAEGIKEKYLDFLLVDSNGNTDLIEIKKPFENAIMTKGCYRDNYIPLRELSGAVMQIEKYVYYLNRWSYEGEKYLTEKYKKELPNGFEIKITNPSGIIIMGREKNLSIDQKRDFEVVKRKYKNVVDIITYDNLLERLRFTISQIKKL